MFHEKLPFLAAIDQTWLPGQNLVLCHCVYGRGGHETEGYPVDYNHKWLIPLNISAPSILWAVGPRCMESLVDARMSATAN